VNSPKIGLFESGSHRIADTPRCPVHHPLVNQVAAALREAIRTTGTPPYHEASQRGLVRYVQIVVERSSQTAQVVLVAHDESPGSLDPLCRQLQSRLGAKLHSLWWNGNPTPHNAILGPHWAHVCGPRSVRERIGGVDVFHPPGAFGQANLPLAEQLVERTLAPLASARRIADVYAGCGAFGLPLLAQGREVHFFERSPDSVAGLREGLAALAEETRRRGRIHEGDVAADPDLHTLIDACDAVILDPPRKGVDAKLIEHLAEHPPERLVYVSCGLPALVRECAVLLGAGRLRLSRLEAWALFPHSDHIETVAGFERRDSRGA
jgi:23S rRNA (uracil1939-C5)-methyltransferase